MFKFLVYFLTFFGVFLYSVQFSNAYAAESKDFVLDALTLYEPQENGEVLVSQDITLTNTKEFVYSPTYSITLKLKNISDIKTSNSKGEIPYTLKEGENNSKIITLTFPERIVGVDAKNSFNVSFSTTDYLKKAGSTHTVSIPAISNIDDFKTYGVAVNVPESFGKASVVKPDISYSANKTLYEFSKHNISKSGISIIFGDTQYYRFNVTYPLENTNLFPVITEIALPSDTAYQEVILENVSPKPDSVYKDKDGNMLAKYSLKPKTKYSVKAKILVKSFIRPIPTELSDKDRKTYTRSQKYWETENSDIKKIVKDLETPEEIFNYVVRALSYNTSKTNDKNERLGAAKVLKDPFFAVCLEFTDLFVTLARAKGIPARAVEGYAHTENDPLRPTDLFQDVLHAWPEYYDDDLKTWVMVDPTWTDTTGGIDFFHIFDFDHVAFVKNGLSSTYPVPAGGYKSTNSKDIEVSFAKSKEFRKVENHVITGNFSPFAQNTIEGTITYLNLGNFETNPDDIVIFVDGKKVSSISFPKTPPLGSSVISVSLLRDENVFSSLTNLSHTITMQDGSKKILFTKRIQVFPVSLPIILGGVVLLGSIIICIIAFKTGRLPILRRKG